MRCGRALLAFGKVTQTTPSLTEALMPAVSMLLGRVNERSKSPGWYSSCDGSKAP